MPNCNLSAAHLYLLGRSMNANIASLAITPALLSLPERLCNAASAQRL